jgi:hypothetical protein
VELEASDAYDLTHGSGLHHALLGSSARSSAVVREDHHAASHAPLRAGPRSGLPMMQRWR